MGLLVFSCLCVMWGCLEYCVEVECLGDEGVGVVCFSISFVCWSLRVWVERELVWRIICIWLCLGFLRVRKMSGIVCRRKFLLSGLISILLRFRGILVICMKIFVMVIILFFCWRFFWGIVCFGRRGECVFISCRMFRLFWIIFGIVR